MNVVYFIQNLDDSLIKIGTTDNLARRLRQIHKGQRTKFKVLGVCDGSYDLEFDFHTRFAADRYASEWFRPSADLLEYIAANTYIPQRKKSMPAKNVKIITVSMPEAIEEVREHIKSIDGVHGLSDYIRQLIEADMQKRGIDVDLSTLPHGDPTRLPRRS